MPTVASLLLTLLVSKVPTGQHPDVRDVDAPVLVVMLRRAAVAEGRAASTAELILLRTMVPYPVPQTGEALQDGTNDPLALTFSQNASPQLSAVP